MRNLIEATAPNTLADDGATLFDDIYAFLGRFIAYPDEHSHVAHVLWIVHTHLMDVWESTPRIAFLSPESGSGKTRCMELTKLLVPRPILAMNCTSNYLIRKIGESGDDLPTILYDEIDTVFGPKAKEHEDTRGLINAGHRKGAVAGRCALKGKQVVTEDFPAYAAFALAGLGFLPETILNRSVVIRMKKRSKDEKVEPYRIRLHEPEGVALQSRTERFCRGLRSRQNDFIPTMPGGITDRDADVWEPLIAVADAVGEPWKGKADVAAVALVAASKGKTGSLGVQLLADIRACFFVADGVSSYYEVEGDKLYNNNNEIVNDKIGSKHLVDKLCGMIESPWADLKGKPLTVYKLGSLLSTFGISSADIRIDDWHGKGYRAEDFHDAWKRYLPSAPVFPPNP